LAISCLSSGALAGVGFPDVSLSAVPARGEVTCAKGELTKQAASIAVEMTLKKAVMKAPKKYPKRYSFTQRFLEGGLIKKA
jgi:hypothetical protein